MQPVHLFTAVEQIQMIFNPTFAPCVPASTAPHAALMLVVCSPPPPNVVLPLPCARRCGSGFVDAGPANLVALTEGIHSKEALELVREHMLGVMGAAASAKFSTELIKMSKFQMAQVCMGFCKYAWGFAMSCRGFSGLRCDGL